MQVFFFLSLSAFDRQASPRARELECFTNSSYSLHPPSNFPRRRHTTTPHNATNYKISLAGHAPRAVFSAPHAVHISAPRRSQARGTQEQPACTSTPCQLESTLPAASNNVTARLLQVPQSTSIQGRPDGHLHLRDHLLGLAEAGEHGNET
jgi:hypothetical protein